ncbi:MAG: type II toxin-antitoxin system prevent-host-death family antitoxin [Sphaerochaetaceae bacterium]|nr:type II toxin-antitoxin system prevent-host-death family antitoxin [Sphaerochaetaceae bacterium]
MMVNISEAKAKLSQLIELAYYGETVVIAKNNLPLVDLVPHRKEEPRELGMLKGSFHVPDDLDAQSDEIEDMFYGENQ